MCGRYTYSKRREQIQSRFEDVDPAELPFTPRYNIAPAQSASVLVIENGRIAETQMAWGFLPKWSKAPIINAQQETIASKPTFKKAFTGRRCLIPADGFYEWKKEGAQKTPMRFVLRDGGTFYFAGLWDQFEKPVRRASEGDLFDAGPTPQPDPLVVRGGEGNAASELAQTFLILTTSANDAVLPVHNRMPAIVRPELYDAWLDADTPHDSLAGILAHLRNDELTAYRVSPVQEKIAALFGNVA